MNFRSESPPPTSPLHEHLHPPQYFAWIPAICTYKRFPRYVAAVLGLIFFLLWTSFVLFNTNKQSQAINPLASTIQEIDGSWRSPHLQDPNGKSATENGTQLPFLQALQTFSVQGHSAPALLTLTAQVTPTPASITAVLTINSTNSLTSQINSILAQTVHVDHIWITAPSSIVPAVQNEVDNYSSGVSIMVFSVDPSTSFPPGSAGHTPWLSVLSDIKTDYTWVVQQDATLDTRALAWVYNVLQTDIYQNALVGTQGSLLPVHKDRSSSLSCVPDQARSLDRTQAVDMIHGSWLLRHSWIPALAASVHPDTLGFPLDYHISQSLLHSAAIPSIVLPDPYHTSDNSQTCEHILTEFESENLWRKSLGQRMHLLDQYTQQTVLFLVDGPIQAAALQPLICRFPDVVHVAVTGKAGQLSGETLAETLAKDGCSATVHDLNVDHTDRLSIDLTTRLARYMSLLRPRVVLHVRDTIFDENLQILERVDKTTVISLPSLEIEHALWIADLSLEALQQWHKIQMDIIIITDRRSQSLHRLLESANDANYLGDQVGLVIHMEQTADETTHELVNDYTWRQGSKTLRHRIQKGGLMPAIVESWYPNNNHNYAVLLEDDIEVSPLFYCWAKYTILKYRYEQSSPHLYGISLYSPTTLELLPEGRRPFHLQEAIAGYPANIPYLSQVPCSWGAVYFPEHWREFHSYLTGRLEDLALPVSQYNITVPNCRSEHWSKSWKKYYIELAYLRAYVMLYPNYKDFESFSTNHLEIGTHIKTVNSKSKLDSFQVSLMINDTLLEQLPNHRLPIYDSLPTLTLWGKLMSHEEMDHIAAEWHKSISACPRDPLSYDTQDILCPFPGGPTPIVPVSIYRKKPKTTKRATSTPSVSLSP